MRAFLVLLFCVFHISHPQNQWSLVKSPTGSVVTGFGFLSGKIFAANNQGVWRSTNSSQNWVLSNFGLTVTSGSTSFVSDSKDNIYTNAGLHKTSNFGDEWIPVKHKGVFPDNYALQNDTLYCSISDSMYFSADQGISWKKLSDNHLFLIGANANLLFAANFSGDVTIYRSTDRGKNWYPSFIPKTYSAYHVVNYRNTGSNGIYFDKKGYVYLSLRNGQSSDGDAMFFRSTDNGASWTNLNFVSEVVFFNEDNSGNIYIANFKSKSIYKSSNSGQNWENISEDLVNAGIYAISINENNLYVSLAGPLIYRKNLSTTSVSSSEQNTYDYLLDYNYPNPFNPSTQIRYTIATDQFVSLKVYNMIGQEVATLVNGIQSQGTHSVTFNGAPLSAGAYLYRIQTESFSATKKLSLIK